MKIVRFEDLEIWQLGIAIVKDIYKLTQNEKFSRDFGLRDQIQRAAVSISSNIVEGFEKNNNNEFIRFLKIAKGSVGEVRNQTHIALTLGYITKEEFTTTEKEMTDLARQIGGLLKYLEEKRKQGEFINH